MTGVVDLGYPARRKSMSGILLYRFVARGGGEVRGRRFISGSQEHGRREKEAQRAKRGESRHREEEIQRDKQVPQLGSIIRIKQSWLGKAW